MARIVIVEDDELVAEAASEILSQAGHMVSAVHHGDEAVDAVLASEPDMVILDYALPGKSGMEILRSLRRLPLTTDMPVMMLTARRGKIHIYQATDEGADDYITKPFSGSELLHRTEALLVGQSISRAATRGAVLD